MRWNTEKTFNALFSAACLALSLLSFFIGAQLAGVLFAGYAGILAGMLFD